MTALEIATGIIDKLQDENRGILDTLHKAQDTIKYSERQLAEKERIIKVLEERIRAGNDGILEMTNQQKELTIKHLEKQIQTLLKKIEDLEVNLEAVKAEICPKCETKLLMYENRENVGLLKSYKPPGKSSSTLLGKKPSEILCPNRIKALERIIEHKDKRIVNLSKEVTRLKQAEKELTQKNYRLTKLLPYTRLSNDEIIDGLLKQIQHLESEKQNNGSSEINTFDAISKVSKPSTSYAFSAKTNPKSTERFKTSVLSKNKTPASNLEFEHAGDAAKFENEVLHRNLQKLCHNINELRNIFASESEQLSHGLNTTANEYRSFKINLQKIINNLNEIVQNMLTEDVRHEEKTQSEEQFIISRLQNTLKETSDNAKKYQIENEALKEKIEKLTAQQDSFPDFLKKSSEKLLRSYSDTNYALNTNDIKKFQEIIKQKDAHLEAAESHINACQKFIDELQKNLKQTNLHQSKLPHFSANADVKTVDSSLEQENKNLKIKIDVSEKNIKTCETVIEQLQKKNMELEEENVRLESKLHEYKSKAISEESDKNSANFSKFSEINTLKKFNQELQDKIRSLEETIKKLQTDLTSSKSRNVTSDALGQENLRLQSTLEAADKQINTLQKSIEIFQEKLKTSENENKRIQTQLEELIEKNNLADAYEDDVMALRNELILKEDENRELKEALHTLENKTLEMNHYRKSLHKEIENLWKAITENEESEDSECRKAIFKAAVSRSAQALLRLDENYNFKGDSSSTISALEELTHQIRVYLTEVSRIHELAVVKEQKNYEKLKEYLDMDDDTLFKLSSPRIFESEIQGEPVDDDLQSFPNLHILKSPDLPDNVEAAKTASGKTPNFKSAAIASELENVQKELAETKSVTAYLLTSCTRLEELLAKERTDRVQCEKELEICQETIRDLKAQLDSKDQMTKHLNSLIDWMRSKEFNDEMLLDKLKNEIQWLYEKTQSTENELRKYKSENEKMEAKLNSMNTELMNEKYERAKASTELKQLKRQVLNSPTIIDYSSSSGP